MDVGSQYVDRDDPHRVAVTMSRNPDGCRKKALAGVVHPSGVVTMSRNPDGCRK